MKWIRLRNRIRSKPELIDPYRVMSYRAAKKTWKIQGRPDTWEFMEGARIKAAKTPSEWEALTGISRKQCVSSANASRRLAIALIVVILMASFMACTVPGRALAKEIYETFTTFVGNMLYVTTEPNTNDKVPIPEEGIGSNFYINQSIVEAYADINQPLLYLNDNKYNAGEITVSKDKMIGTSLFTNYRLDDIQINIIQRWFPEGYVYDTNILLENAQYFTTKINDHLQFYGSYTDFDHTYIGTTLVKSSVVYVTITNIYNIEIIDQILNDLIYYPQ